MMESCTTNLDLSQDDTPSCLLIPIHTLPSELVTTSRTNHVHSHLPEVLHLCFSRHPDKLGIQSHSRYVVPCHDLFHVFFVSWLFTNASFMSLTYSIQFEVKQRRETCQHVVLNHARACAKDLRLHCVATREKHIISLVNGAKLGDVNKQQVAMLSILCATTLKSSSQGALVAATVRLFTHHLFFSFAHDGKRNWEDHFTTTCGNPLCSLNFRYFVERTL